MRSSFAHVILRACVFCVCVSQRALLLRARFVARVPLRAFLSARVLCARFGARSRRVPDFTRTARASFSTMTLQRLLQDVRESNGHRRLVSHTPPVQGSRPARLLHEMRKFSERRMLASAGAFFMRDSFARGVIRA